MGVLAEGAAGIWGLAGRFIAAHNRTEAVEGGGEAVELLANWTEPKDSLSRAARPGLASVETVPVCAVCVRVECG